MSESTISIPAWSERNEVLERAAASLSAADGPADAEGTWPEALWRIVSEAGANRWALPASVGGPELDRLVLLERYARVAEGSLTAAFILSQHDAAVRRLAAVAVAGGLPFALSQRAGQRTLQLGRAGRRP